MKTSSYSSKIELLSYCKCLESVALHFSPRVIQVLVAETNLVTYTFLMFDRHFLICSEQVTLVSQEKKKNEMSFLKRIFPNR